MTSRRLGRHLGRFPSSAAPCGERRAESLGIAINRDNIERALLQDAMQAQPAAATAAPEQADSSEVLGAFGIDVLGEMDDQSIMCWIPDTGKRWKVKSPANWRVEEMFQAMGRRALEGLWREQGRPPEGRYTPDALKQAVAIVAATAPRLAAVPLGVVVLQDSP